MRYYEDEEVMTMGMTAIVCTEMVTVLSRKMQQRANCQQLLSVFPCYGGALQKGVGGWGTKEKGEGVN